MIPGAVGATETGHTRERKPWERDEYDATHRKAADHWCAECETYRVQREGALCPICRDDANTELTPEQETEIRARSVSAARAMGVGLTP